MGSPSEGDLSLALVMHTQTLKAILSQLSQALSTLAGNYLSKPRGKTITISRAEFGSRLTGLSQSAGERALSTHVFTEDQSRDNGLNKQ